MRIGPVTIEEGLRYIQRNMGVDVIFSPEQVRKRRTRGLSGDYTPQQAIERLLAGSGLQAKPNGRSQYIIVETLVAQAAPERPAQNPAALVPQQPAWWPAEIDEIIITGSRIVREGYEAPTPLTVVSANAIDNSADMSLVNFLNTMPALTGSSLMSSGQSNISAGTSGMQTLNLRSLGANRVLVLLDGQRTVGSSLTGLVDVGNFPAQLVSRVDIVTGGASAVYGSDAVGGVVNFILDKKFVGVKAEISGGLTNYGDDRNYKVDLSGGFGFADDRGHVLLSGEHMYSKGIQGDGGRKWNRTGMNIFTNPAYTSTNGQPFQLLAFGTALGVAAPGGLIVSGPLKGTAFGAGGAPYTFKYGSTFFTPYMQGGDWASNNLQQNYDLDPSQNNQSIFTRVSYDVADGVNVFVQYAWSQDKNRNILNQIHILGGLTGPTISIDNAFLPSSVRAAMAANNVTSFPFGTTNADFPSGFGNNNTRITNRLNTGVDGTFTAVDTLWHWNAYYAYGATKANQHNPGGPVRARYAMAIDAVVNPVTGQIVCRSSLTNPSDGCKPWNPLGVGVNTGNEAAWDWMSQGGSAQHTLVEETTFAAFVSGEPFSLPAGPVSLAISAEHRWDKIHATVDPYAAAFARYFGNYGAIDGSQSVTEGALETIIPLAKDERWAKAWDFTAAARFTGYELAGYVTTYKFGTTYTPIDDIKFRVTRSRDIRAPNINELFASPQAQLTGAGLIDRFLNNVMTQSTTQTVVSGNANLLPEKGDTTGIGVVLSPRFIRGFTASIDFWDVDIHGAIQPLTGQQVIDSCYSGQNTSLCPNIIRDANGLITQVKAYSINLTTQDVRGIDLEASYRTPVSSFMSDWRGDFSLRGLMTFYLRNYQDNTFNEPSNHVGENSGVNPPHWKLTTTATYALDPVSVSLTARAVSGGTVNSEYVQCTSACPLSTTDHITVNSNHLAGRFYLDANVSYKLDLGETTRGELFFSVRNMFNNDPPLGPTSVVSQYYVSTGASAALYDQIGAVYRAGVRFRM